MVGPSFTTMNSIHPVHFPYQGHWRHVSRQLLSGQPVAMILPVIPVPQPQPFFLPHHLHPCVPLRWEASQRRVPRELLCRAIRSRSVQAVSMGSLASISHRSGSQLIAFRGSVSYMIQIMMVYGIHVTRLKRSRPVPYCSMKRAVLLKEVQ